MYQKTRIWMLTSKTSKKLQKVTQIATDLFFEKAFENFGFSMICRLIIKSCRFAICGLAHLRQLGICNSGMKRRAQEFSDFE